MNVGATLGANVLDQLIEVSVQELANPLPRPLGGQALEHLEVLGEDLPAGGAGTMRATEAEADDRGPAEPAQIQARRTPSGDDRQHAIQVHVRLLALAVLDTGGDSRHHLPRISLHQLVQSNSMFAVLLAGLQFTE